MTDTRTIHVQSPSGKLDTLSVEVPDAAPWKLVVSGVGLQNRVFEGDDLFEALIALRLKLEETGYRVLCAGARVDVFPSGMSRNMGGARKAYITRLGEPATNLIDIFDEAKAELVGTVEGQKEFHNKWGRSLTEQK